MRSYFVLIAAALMIIARSSICVSDEPKRLSVEPRTSTVERLPPTQVDATADKEKEEKADDSEVEKTPSGEVSPVAFEEEFGGEGYGPVYQPPPELPTSPNATRLLESTWYTRIDYFYWAEQVDNQPFMRNEGVVPVLGWQQRRGQQRYRAEVFAGRPDYTAEIAGFDIKNVTDYVGLRGEYELMYEPPSWKLFSFFGGVGSRFFVRSIPDIIINNSILIDGYQEAWWTFYPYVGLESRRTMSQKWDVYFRARTGVTAYTWEHVALDDATLFPRANFTGQLEMGFRGPRLFLSFYTEVFAWSQSAKVIVFDGVDAFQVRQPNSQNVMVGLKSGWSY